MQDASAHRMRPRRGASSTDGSAVGSTRSCIGRNCNGQMSAGERSHRGGRKLCRRPDVVPGVSMADGPDAVPDRATGRAYLVWGVALVAYVLAVFHRASLGVAAVQ